MPYTPPTVNYATSLGGTYTTLTGVQSVTITRGRQRFQDPFPATQMRVELIPANSYTTPLAVGQVIDVRPTNTATNPAYFSGIITDVQRSYSFPYNAGTGAAPADRITITASGPTGLVGSNTVTNATWSATTFNSAVNQLLATINVWGANKPFYTNNTAQTFSGAALDAVNQLLRTAYGVIDDMDSNRNASYFTYPWAVCIQPIGQVVTFDSPYTFSDDGSSTHKYVGLEYLSSVQSAFTQVNVAPTGLASQTASTGSAPYNTLVYSTYNQTTDDAANLANYVLTVNTQTAPTPFMLTTNTLVDPNILSFTFIPTLQASGYVGINQESRIGSSCIVTFRGTTVPATIQGMTTTFYPDHAQLQVYLSPSLGTPFTLDSAYYGVLDTNRLGFP